MVTGKKGGYENVNQRVVLKDNVRDKWSWLKDGYHVKEAYSMIMKGVSNEGEEDRKLTVAWNNLVPLKVLVLVWRIWRNKIPTRDNLVKRDILVASQNSCPHSCDVEESVSHTFFECSIAQAAWSEIIWNKRNEKIFRKEDNNNRSIMEDIQDISWQWLKINIDEFNYGIHQWMTNPKECLGRRNFQHAFCGSCCCLDWWSAMGGVFR
ncbi:unnamed protein product [Vicia faba]|uniref:Reverse transcriptase zinc-binding domain-containing protein n=1 Tax=Vicia faba TaxID=3906 RepID=A0AAV1A762_VICFA|nr:unnamed protein product [Vicia faba]